MFYGFDTKVAKQVGVPSAVVFAYMDNLLSMYASIDDRAIDGNSECARFNGKTWVRMSVRSLAEKMPCFTESQVKRALSKLVSCGYLEKARLAKGQMDATCFYSLR